VKAKGKDLDHRKAVTEDRGISEYAFDYFFPGDELGFKLTILGGRERLTGMNFATAVPTKGGSGRFPVDKALDFIEEIGDANAKVILKNDQEPSIQYFIKDLIEQRVEGRTILEESPVKSSGSNGVVERGVQGCEGHLRALLLALEERTGVIIDPRMQIVSFMPEYAAYLMNRLEVGKDGKTAYERVKGKKATVLGIEFGEKLKDKLQKINARWEFGIFVGVRRRSGEVWVAVKGKVMSVRSVRRIPVEERWGKDCIEWVDRVMWNRYKGDEGADGELPEGVPAPVEESRGSGGLMRGPEVIIVETKNTPPREFYIKKSDADRLGYTRGCGGCNSWHRGLGRQAHTDACRERFRGLMKDEARVKNAEERKKEFEERELSKKRRKDEKKEERKRKEKETPEDGEAKRRREEKEVEERKRKQEAENIPAEVKRRRDLQEPSSSSTSMPPNPQDLSNMEVGEVRVDIGEAKVEIDNWVCEIKAAVVQQEEEEKAEDAENEYYEDFTEEGIPNYSSQDLSHHEVCEARGEEMEFLKEKGVWCERSVRECWEKTGKAPVSVRWVDVRKGSGEVRSRLVARDFKGGEKGRDDLFAATPPLEGKRLLVSRAVTRRKDGRKRKLRFIDVKKAHLNPKCHEDVYIELPDESGKPKDVCGKLRFWLYGFRKAASAWEDLYAEKFREAGFTRGRGCGVLFVHHLRDLQCVVHGDDFTFCGLQEDIEWITTLMKTWFEIKVRATLGPEDQDDKEVVILGRTLRWKNWGIEWEADQKHRAAIMDHFGFREGHTDGLNVNGEKKRNEDDEFEDEEVDNYDATTFRGLVARINFLSQDCPELQYPAKELSREMCKPKCGSWKRLKKVARFLVKRRRVVWKFGWQDEVSIIEAFSDSDWGGSVGSRKSTSGGALMMGRHCIKTWSSTQGAVALSSAEAEFYAMIEAVIRAKWLVTVAVELGWKDLRTEVKVATDSSAAKSFVSRRGLGKMRHIEVRDLWLQEEVLKGNVEVVKVKGTENPADLMTKYLTVKEIHSRLSYLHLRLCESGHEEEGR
jgi:hypothetical protein